MFDLPGNLTDMTKSRGIRVRRGTRQVWLAENQGRHFCECGCGEAIPLKAEHFNTGIPRFLWGHNSKVDPPNKRPTPPRLPCECGCGELTSPGKRYRSGHNNKGREVSAETRAKIGAANGGENNWNWGGRSPRFKGRVKKGPYILRWCDSHPFITHHQRTGGYVLEHRLVMEEHLRETAPTSPYLVEVDGVLYLRPEVEVHHVNGVKDDNSVGNLQAMTKAEHTAHHATERHAKRRAS